MSKFRTIPYAVLSAGLLAAGGASAQSMGSIDQRQDYQQDRIERGIRDGQITRSEAYRLEQGERAIDRAQARARADGAVTPQERARLDRMVDREGRAIYRESHDNQRADGRSWGGHDGWGRDRDGWGRNEGWNRDHDGGDRGRHEGWARGEHNGWDGNRPPGIERRDARQDQRIHDGMRDGSLTRGEANRLERGQDHINRYEARARSDGVVTPQERNRIDNVQNRESRQIYAARHNDRTAPTTTSATGTPPAGSHNWGNAGWRQPQAGNTPPTTPGTQPNTGSRNWSGWHTQQASAAPTAPAPGTQPNTGSRNWSGFRTQQASATPTATPRPTMTRASSPAPSPSTGARSYGGRH
jgi:hypothetical protein